MSKIICHNLSGEEFEVDSSELYFRPSIYGVLIENGKVLLSKQHDGYDLPGGGINIDETLDEALEREFWEETGLKVSRGRVIYCQSSFFKPRYGKKQPFNAVLIYCLVTKISGELSKDNLDDHEKEYADMPEWIDVNEIDGIKFYNPIDNVALVEEALKIKNYQ